MGSFNGTCGLSGLPITDNDRVAIILLQRNKYEAPKHGYSMTTYANGLFKPYFGLVYGNYDDYGTLENITEDSNTAALETIFGMPTESIIKTISSNDRSIYSEHGGYPEAYGLPEKSFGWQVSRDDSFTKLGFTRVVTDAVYDYGKYTVTVIDDYKWDVTTEDVGTERINISDLEEGFEKVGVIMGFYPGYKPSDYNRINQLRETSLMMIRVDVFEAMKEVKLDDWDARDDTQFVEDWDKWLAATENGTKQSFTDVEFIRRSTAIDHSETDYLFADGMKDIMLDVSRLFGYLTQVNRRFEPGMYGSQDFNEDFFQAIYTVGNKFFAENRYDEDDEDELDD